MNKKGLLKQQIESIKHSPWAFFVNRLRVTLLLFITLVIGGIFSIFALPVELDPEVEIPIGMVTTVFPGASPSDVEKLVTDKLETHLKNLDDLKHLMSSSQEGISSVIVEFEASADVKGSMRKLREEVDNIKSELPEEAEEPVIIEYVGGDFPIVTFSLSGNLPPEDFKFFGGKLKERLERINGVSKVVLSGIEEKEIQVLIDIKALEGFNLPLSKVVNVIKANNIDFPIGNILTKDFYYSVSLKGQLDTEKSLLELPITNIDGRNVYLKDIAEVREVFAEKRTKTKLYQHSTKEYKPSITLQVYKKTGANAIDVANAAKDEAVRFQEKVLPQNVEVLNTGDIAEYLSGDMDLLNRSGLQAIVLIFLLLFLTLGFKEAVLSAVSIPFVFLISFIVLFLYGETYNAFVLFGLILSVGLIVDTSIVITEGVHENIKHKRLPPKDSALMAIKTYKDPLISSSLTTIFAFIPIAMMTGIIGEYMKHLPIAVIITLLVDIFVAIFLLPAWAFHIFQKYKYNPRERPPLADQLMTLLREWYVKHIKKILASKRNCRRWITGMIIASAIAISFPFIGILKIHLFPQYNANFIVTDIEAPISSTLEDTSKIAEKVEKLVEDLPELDNFVTIIGGQALYYTGKQEIIEPIGINYASITVNLKKKAERKLKSYEISEILREKVKSITEAEIKVRDFRLGPPITAPVEIRVIGEDMQKIEDFAELVKRELKQIKGIRDVSTDIEHGTGEFHFTLKRDQLEFYGLSAAQWGNEIRTAIFGSKGIKVIRAGEETPIVVRLDFRDEECKQDQITQLLEKRDKITICNLNPKNISQIERLLIPTPRGQVPLSELVEIELKPTISIIRHRNGEMIVSVTASTQPGVLPVEVTDVFQERMKEITIPEGIEIEYGGELERANESFRDLRSAMIIALLLIFLVLILQFNSFKQPFIILFTLPLAFIGVFFGLALIGHNFSFSGFLGIVALSGIVVNDAIILIDRINSNIRYGMDKLKAIITAGKERFQPIILTTITTAAAVFPLTFASENLEDMAWAVFFGVIFATVLTLIMVPIFYIILEKVEEQLI